MLHVGARLEVVAPRRISDRRDWGYLLALLLISLLVHGWQIYQNRITAKDSIGFARYGWNLLHPNKGQSPGPPRSAVLVVQENHHPPGFPLMVGLAAELVRPFYDKPLPDQLTLASQVASALAALLLVIPTYALGKLLFNRGVGFGVALLLQFLPVFAREATDGLNDCAHLCFVAFALLFAARGLRRPRVGQFLLVGIFSGLAFMVRPEGLEVVLALTITTIGFVVTKRWPLRPTIGLFVALGVGTLLISAPYMMVIGKFTNKPSGDIGTPTVNPRANLMKASSLVGGPPFAAAYRDLGFTDRLTRTPVEFAKEVLKTTHYSIAILGVIGLWFLRPRLKEQPELWLLIVYAGLHTLLLFTLGLAKGYLSERHTLPLAMCLTYFAVAGLKPLCEWLTRLPLIGSLYAQSWMPCLIVGLIVASCVPPLFKTRHQGRLGQVHAGEYLRGKIDEADQLFDPYEWAGFYSERTLYRIPADPYMTTGRARWIVWEDGDAINSLQSLRWDETKAYLAAGLADKRAELMFESNVPNVKNLIRVYRIPFTADEVARDVLRKKADEEAKPK